MIPNHYKGQGNPIQPCFDCPTPPYTGGGTPSGPGVMQRDAFIMHNRDLSSVIERRQWLVARRACTSGQRDAVSATRSRMKPGCGSTSTSNRSRTENKANLASRDANGPFVTGTRPKGPPSREQPLGRGHQNASAAGRGRLLLF
jgi:hypothetical protein